MGNLDGFRKNKILTNCEKYLEKVDYLRFSLSEPIQHFENIVKKLVYNTSNSNIFVEGVLTYQFISFSQGYGLMISTTRNDVSIPIMQYVKFGRQNNIQKMWGKLDFYGAFFRLQEIGILDEYFIDSFVYKYFNENPAITRIDYTYDFFYNKPQKFPNRDDIFPNVRSNTKIQDYGTGGKKETFYVGTPSSNRYCVRMYDKLKESTVKGKLFFYSDYLSYADVHRLEFEFGPHFCKGYSYKVYQDLLDKCATFIGFTDKDFKGKLFYEYQPNFEINDFNRTQFTKQFIGRSSKYLINGLNFLLVLHDYYINLPTCEEKKKYLEFGFDFIKTFDLKVSKKLYKNIKEKLSLHNNYGEND